MCGITIPLPYTASPPNAQPTVLRTQRPQSLGLSRRSSLCITQLPSTRPRHTVSHRYASPGQPLLSEQDAFTQQLEAAPNGEQDDAAAADDSELHAVLSPLRQLDLNAPPATTPCAPQPKEAAMDAGDGQLPLIDGQPPLNLLLQLCGQTVCELAACVGQLGCGWAA